MIENGRKILTAEVGGWYACGTPAILLETNQILLEKGAGPLAQWNTKFPIPQTVCTSILE